MAKLFCFFVIFGFFTSPTYAQVIEIGADGEATVYDAPTIFADGSSLPVFKNAASSSQPNMTHSSAPASVDQ